MKVRVKVHVQLGDKAYEPNQVVELDEATAKASPWAFEEVEKVEESKS